MTGGAGGPRRVAHISDLHFGRTRPELIAPLLDALAAAEPHLIVVSGDLTQRARTAQFRAARDFLDRLPAPWLAVPGNHDTPLDHLAVRLFRPWVRYRRWVHPTTAPEYDADGLFVVGANSANALDWQRGRLGPATLARMRARFERAPPGAARIAVIHHPLVHLRGARKALPRGGAAALDALGAAGVEIILSGHLHVYGVDAPETGRASRARMIQVQAGTGLSTRMREEPNTFNLLRLDGPEVAVEHHAAQEGRLAFERIGGERFRRGPEGFVRRR